MKSIIFLAVCASLMGCSQAAKTPEEFDSAPPSRVYGFTKKSDAQLIVIHNSTEVNCAIRLSIDGKHAADLEAGEKAHFGVTIGTHKIAALPLNGCVNPRTQQEKIYVNAGDALLRRIGDSNIDAGTR